jgi:hypothetical protein
MDNIGFVNLLKKIALTDGMKDYENIYRTMQNHMGDAKELDGIRSLQFFGELSDNQRDVFFLVMRQTIVDTLSITLAVIDGISTRDGEGVRLISEADEKILSGDLQTILLNSEEEMKQGKYREI